MRPAHVAVAAFAAAVVVELIITWIGEPFDSPHVRLTVSVFAIVAVIVAIVGSRRGSSPS